MPEFQTPWNTAFRSGFTYNLEIKTVATIFFFLMYNPSALKKKKVLTSLFEKS